ncbi:MAG: ATP-binding cassette domain-containing protein [Deltaproteobacteria bacterium]|nr:ATP-binding cassette domain-containing protein [Deltaproteobacteria bacterium]
MALISFKDVSVGFGGHPLLDHVNFQIERGERACLLGRNGAGKSTLLRLIQGDILTDDGEIVRQQGVRIAMLPQDVPRGLVGATIDVVAGGLETDPTSFVSEDAGRRLQVEKTLSRMNLDPQARFETLSAGLKRRVMLARGLACDPDILLLDEPTNHLDIDAIGWMEEFLLRYGGTLLFVTHDRMFLQKLATRILELDRGYLTNWSCNYVTFQERKQAALDAEAGHRAEFDKKLAREETWIRQGVKARRTRNEGRVRMLEKMREDRRSRRDRMGSVRLRAQDAGRSGKLVVEVEDVSCGYDSGAPVIRDFSTVIQRGDKVGIMGPNGAGKTTLLRLLLGDLAPQKGMVRHGVRLETAYFDQLRAQLDENKSVADNVGEGNDTVQFNGKSRHIIGYLQDFLFSPERSRSPVRILSGGERNRLLLARLFTKPSNVLIMDEPTNDLDTETLELLEELLFDYPGTLLLVSHDRAFLNNVVTSTLVLEGRGRVGEYVGGYDDWLRQRSLPEPPIKAEKVKIERAKPARERRQTLTFKQQRELEALPGQIEALEAEQKNLYQAMSDPLFYQQAGDEIARAKARLEALEQEIETACLRWEELESLNGN